MDRPHRDPGGRALTLPRRFRLIAAAVGIVALGALWRTASVARTRILADADARAARIAAGYLGVLTSADRPDRASPEMRLLSAAGDLAASRFWRSGLQVWLAGTPILVGDTAGHRAALAGFDVGESAGAGQVAVWSSVPPESGVPLLAVSGGFALAALLLVAVAGEFMRTGRSRAAVVALGLLIVSVGEFGEARGVYTTWRDAQDAGLLKARRILEITALGRRLTDAEVAGMGGELVVTPIPSVDAVRDTVVVRDTVAAHLSAVAARGQAWKVAAPDGVARYALYWRLLLGWGMLALLAGFVAAALPPGARYLSASRPDSPISP